MSTFAQAPSDSTPGRRFLKERKVGLVLVIGLVVLALALGVLAGMRTPLGTKQVRESEGIAIRALDGDRVEFVGDDGTQLVLRANDVWWAAEGAEGDGNPPCLRTAGEQVEVAVGWIQVARPLGGWFQQGQWVRCL